MLDRSPQSPPFRQGTLRSSASTMHVTARPAENGPPHQPRTHGQGCWLQIDNSRGARGRVGIGRPIPARGPGPRFIQVRVTVGLPMTYMRNLDLADCRLRFRTAFLQANSACFLALALRNPGLLPTNLRHWLRLATSERRSLPCARQRPRSWLWAGSWWEQFNCTPSLLCSLSYHRALVSPSSS